MAASISTKKTQGESAKVEALVSKTATETRPNSIKSQAQDVEGSESSSNASHSLNKQDTFTFNSKVREDSTARAPDVSQSDQDLESIFQNREANVSHDSQAILSEALTRSEILRNDLKKIGLLSTTLTNHAANDEINPEAFRVESDDNERDESQGMESQPNDQESDRLAETVSQSDQDPYDEDENGRDMSTKGYGVIRPKTPYDSKNGRYSEDERDWIVDELANAGTGSQVPQDDFVWSDTAEDLMTSSTKELTPTMGYVKTEAVMRGDEMNTDDDNNIMMMTPTSDLYKATPAYQLKSTSDQEVDFKEPDYLLPEFGTDSSGGFENENGVSGNFGDVGDEIDFEVIKQIKKNKIARPTNSSDGEVSKTTESHIAAGGNATSLLFSSVFDVSFSP